MLFSKCDNPSSVMDFRSISLCNVVYKIISMLLCSRLKRVLAKLVDESQPTFIFGRWIQDNVLISFETIHTMSTPRKGKKADVALKIDKSKAYDQVDWLEN